MPEPSERTALYRLYDADDRLLYVGITTDPNARWERHAMLKWWWGQVARKGVRWLDASWADALKIEAETIQAERPAFNGTHNFAVAPFVARDWPTITVPRGKAAALAELVREEIRSGRWQTGARIPTRGEIAAASGVSETTSALAYRTLQNEGLIQCLHGLGTVVSNGTTIKPRNRQIAPKQAQ